LQDFSKDLSTGTVKTQADVNAKTAAPTQQQTQNTQTSPTTGGSPYFMGQYAIIKIAGNGYDNNTIWLVDTETKTLRPFSSSSALQNFFSAPVDLNNIKTVSSSELNPGGLLGDSDDENGFEVLSSEYAIKSDGTAKPVNFSGAQLSSRYGQSVNTALEAEKWTELNSILDYFGKNGALTPAQVQKIKGDPSNMAFYMNALTYGGYTLLDVYKDAKKRELGITEVSPISAASKKEDYSQTNDYVKADGDARLTPPAQIGELSSNDLNLSIYQLPDELFKTLVPLFDYESPDFKAKMDQVQSAYYDVLQQQLNASTEQEKAIADYNWKQYKEKLEKDFGMSLSNNAIEAWKQLQTAINTFSERGIRNSGLESESIDDYLTSVRRTDQVNRDQKIDAENDSKKSYYTQYATPAQIALFVSEISDLAKQGGLVPSDDVRNALSLDALKAKYPNSTEDQLKKYIATVLDENGNYRSGLYQKYSQNKATLSDQTDEYKRDQVYSGLLRDEEKAYKEFTSPDIAFLRAAEGSGVANTDMTSYTPASQNSINLAETIKKAYSQGLGYTPTSSTQTPATAKAPVTNTTPASYQNISQNSSPVTSSSYGQPQTQQPVQNIQSKVSSLGSTAKPLSWDSGAMLSSGTLSGLGSYGLMQPKTVLTSPMQTATKTTTPMTTKYSPLPVLGGSVKTSTPATYGGGSTGTFSSLADMPLNVWNKVKSSISGIFK
jgi:hypothetical protein